MHIDRIHVQSYRSLYDVTFEPGTFRLLVGPNNAGKTNLLDALHFLGEVHRYGISTAVGRKGGFENIAHRHQRRAKRPISFDVTATVSEDDLRPARRRTPARRGANLYTVRHSFH